MANPRGVEGANGQCYGGGEGQMAHAADHSRPNASLLCCSAADPTAHSISHLRSPSKPPW